MGKRKREGSRQQFSESIDPRFSGIFESKNTEVKQNEVKGSKKIGSSYQKDGEGFQNFIAGKLSSFLDKNFKGVDRPVIESDIFKNRIDSIRLFSDSNEIHELEVEDSVSRKPKKKKHKKDKSLEKECLKEAVVTIDFLQRQAHLLNS